MLAIFFSVCCVFVYGFIFWILKTKNGKKWLASL